MCLVKMKVEHEEDEIPSPPRRVIVRPASSSTHHGSERIILGGQYTTPRPVSRSHSHHSSRRSSRVISVVEQRRPTSTHSGAPRASQYVLSPPASTPGPQPGSRTSIPRIIHAAPSPPRSPQHRPSASPRISYTSIHSSRDSPPGSGSPRGSRTRVVSSSSGDAVVYVSTERERGGTEILRRRSARGTERPRSTGHFLTTGDAGGDGGGYAGYIEPSRQRKGESFLEDHGAGGDGLRARSRSITYVTTSGPRVSRERVLVDQGDGRRRESYQVIGGGGR